MFAYCANNPVIGYDPTGTRVELWPILFGQHDPGYIHRAVQAHIIMSGAFCKELYLPGIGRADIFDPKTREIWEIKHGGHSAETQNERTLLADGQINRYIKDSKALNKQIYMKGHAGAFTGEFVINAAQNSYLVTYTTPSDGVILYNVQQLHRYEYEASFVYLPLTQSNEQANLAKLAGLATFAFLGGSMFWDPLCYQCQ